MGIIEIVRPMLPPLENIAARFSAALKAGKVTNGGEYVQEFERRLTQYVGAPTAVFCNGQTALMTMLAAAGVEGGEVIVPGFTFCATPHAVRWAGAEPVFVDVTPDTMTLDVEQVYRAVNKRTAAIVGVDVYGICCDYAALERIGADEDIHVLFDSAPAFGSLVDGVPCGGRGDAQMFSFHATKGFSTMEGGAICSRNLDFLEWCRRIRNFGQDEGGQCNGPGLNGKMTEVCALVGLEALKTWPKAALDRKVAAERLAAALMGVDGIRIPSVPAGQSPVWLYMPVILQPGVNRDAVVERLHARGVMARRYYSPAAHRLECYLPLDYSLPVSESLAASVVALPVFAGMTDAEREQIVNAVREAVK